MSPAGLAVTVVELPARFGAVQTQLSLLRSTLARAPVGELVLVGECALTGYLSPALEFDPSPFAEPLEGPTAARLALLAREFGTHLVAPLVERAGAQVFNSMVGFGPDGARCLHYRKRHPWYPEGWATPGDLPWPLLTVRGVTCTLAICFDLHFLPTEAAEALAQADVLLFPSAWVEETDSRPQMLSALARQFDVDVVNANWGPGDVVVPGQGRSMVVWRDGARRLELAPGAGRLDVRL